ncbi:MAG: HAD family hydrolase [Clostridium sp.]
MIKLIVSDIDGTLVGDGGNKINPEVFDVIMKLKKEKKIHFAAASGRQAASIEYTFKPIQKEIFYVAENGAYVGCYGRTLFLYPIEMNLANELSKDIRLNPHLQVMVDGAKGTYLESKNRELIDWMTEGYHFHIIPVDDITKIDDEIIKVAAYKKTGIQDDVGALFDKYGDQFKMTISGDMWMDCMRKGVNKGEAVKTLQESLNITPEETMVFGDQLNDIEMLGRAYYSFAVGNARAEVKAAARFQTDTNLKDGVIKILRTLL